MIDDTGGPMSPPHRVTERDVAPAPSQPLRTHPLDVLVPGIAAQSTTAYSELYALLADRLFAFAFRMLGDVHDAEDAVQQAFLELARTPSPPPRGRSLEAWLFTSIRFTCTDVRRQRSRRPSVPTEPVPDSGREDLYEIGLDPHVENALKSLTDQQRAVLHLKHFEGLEGDQIADILGLSRMAVYATAARAERRLRSILSEVREVHPLMPFAGGDRG